MLKNGERNGVSWSIFAAIDYGTAGGRTDGQTDGGSIAMASHSYESGPMRACFCVCVCVLWCVWRSKFWPELAGNWGILNFVFRVPLDWRSSVCVCC